MSNNIYIVGLTDLDGNTEEYPVKAPTKHLAVVNARSRHLRVRRATATDVKRMVIEGRQAIDYSTHPDEREVVETSEGV